MTVNLQGKTAVVTGAGTGIGRGIALKLATCGARVAAHYNASAEGAEDTVRLIEAAGGSGFVLRANLTSAAEGMWMVEQAIERFGRLDILVNNAALSTEKPFFDVTE